MVWWFSAAVATAQPCPDRDVLVAGFRDAVAQGVTAEAGDVRERLVAAFGCGGRAEPPQLVGLWLALSAFRDAKEGLDAGNVALRSAHRLDDFFDDAYGADRRRRWQDARRAPILPSRLAVDAAGGRYSLLLVDGLPFEPPDLLEAGLHLVQWGDSADDVAGARVIETFVDETLTIEVPYGGPTGALAARPVENDRPRKDRPEPTPRPFEPPVEKERRGSPFLVVAGVAGVGALVTAGLTAAVGPDANEPGVDVGATLGRRFDQQRALGFTSFGLMALSGVSLGIHIVR